VWLPQKRQPPFAASGACIELAKTPLALPWVEKEREMFRNRKLGILAAAALTTATLATTAVQNASAAQIYFSSRQSGEIVKTQYSNSPYNVTISGDNFVPGHPDLAVIFDSNRPQTYDTDILYPWDGGNLFGKKLDQILILPENKIDANNDGFIDNPDDEGGQPPAGEIIFKFSKAQKTFGLDLIDMGDVAEERDKSFLQFKKGTTVKKVFFTEFSTLGNQYYDPTIVWGNNSANRLKPVTAAQLGLSDFTEVRVHFHDSAALDNVMFTTTIPPIPEPAALSLLALPAFLRTRRRRK